MAITLFCTVATLFFSYLFLDAGYRKLSEFGYLRNTIAQYRVLPSGWSGPVARILPAMELTAGVGLLIPLSHRVAAMAICGALLSYTAAIAVNIIRGRRDLDCGCAGPGAGQPISGALVVRNTVLFVLALALAAVPLSSRIPLDTPGIFLALAAALLCALIYQVINQLVANQDKLRSIVNHG